MTSNLNLIAATVASLLLTYWIHSTIAIALTWLLTRGRDSSTLHDRLWKFAAVAGLVSAPIQVLVFGTIRATENLPVAAKSHVESVHFEPAIDVTTAQPRIASRSIAQRISKENGPGAKRAIAFADQTTGASAASLGDQRDTSETPAFATLRSETFAAQSSEIPDSPDSFASSASTDAALQATASAQTSATASATGPNEIVTFAPSEEFPAVPKQSAAAAKADSTWFAGQQFAAIGFVLSPIPILCVPLGLLLIGIRAFALRRRAMLARPLNGAVRQTLDQLLHENGIDRRVELLCSEQYAEPVAFGAFRWTIVLPKGIEERLTGDEVRALLAHELAHLVRGDLFWLWIGQAICLCLPFQPLNFVARRRWQWASEFLCDQWAVSRGVEALKLARCLVEITQWSIERRCHVSLAASGDSESIVARVERLVDAKPQLDLWATRSGRWMLLTARTSVLVLMVVGTPLVAFPALRPVIRPAPDPGSARLVANTRDPASPPAAQSSDDDEFAALQKELDHLNELLQRAALTPAQRELAEQIAHRAQLLRKTRKSLVE